MMHEANGAPEIRSNRLRFMLFRLGIIAIIASALLPTTAAAQADYRVPWLKGIQAITVSVVIHIDGSRASDASSCHLERAALEHHSAEVLHGAGLNAIGEMESSARLQALHAELNDAIRALREAPPGTLLPGLQEQSERRTREGNFLASQPFLFVNVGVATLDGGLCAAGIDIDLRAFAREKPVINYNDEQQQAPLSIWGATPLALATPAAELESAVTERLDRQITQFINAWRTANGQ